MPANPFGQNSVGMSGFRAFGGLVCSLLAFFDGGGPGLQGPEACWSSGLRLNWAGLLGFKAHTGLSSCGSVILRCRILG